jgi:hypothetical protein
MTTENDTNTQEASSSAAHGSGALVRIHWIDRETGNCGSGEPITRDEAEAALRDVEPQYPFIQHWLVEV